MTIKQQGGVFGRNPSLNDLDVNTLDVSGVSTFGAQATIEASWPRLTHRKTTNTSLLETGIDASGAYIKGTYVSGGTADVRFIWAASEKLRITNNGITFNGDTAAANALDDYEEGTWTPTYLLTTTDFDSITYDAVRYGAYTKIGNKVFCTVSIRTDAITVGAGAGSLAIGGLPFTVLSGAANNASSGLPGYYASWTSAPGGVYPTAGQTYATIGIPGTTSNATSAILNTGANSNFISLQFFYTAA